jgi:hypothetical protein
MPSLAPALTRLTRRNVGGQERTTDEYAALLARSGLRLVRAISLRSSAEAMGHCIVEAAPGDR